MRKPFLILLIITYFHYLQAQTTNNLPVFISPVRFPIYLSGSFAELRTDHFHSGIDIKTQGIGGKAVHSVADGYVSRIKIQSNGYGKSIYIHHPNGYTSVYGHLSEYNETLDKYVKNYQYKNQTHTLDIYPGANELPVKQGDLIALSGNTGSSSGPHLHFEIRKTSNQHTMNVQKFGYDIADNVAPRISNFYIYSFEGEGHRSKIKARKKVGLNLSNNIYTPKNNDTIEVQGPVSFGMEVYDFMNGTSNRYGIYYVKMFVGGELFYYYQADEFSFSETRYINAHSDYELRIKKGEKVQLLFKMPNNRLSMYKTVRGNGIIFPEADSVRLIDIQFGDISGNSRNVKFTLLTKAPQLKQDSPEIPDKILYKWDTSNEFENQQIKIFIPGGSLYEDTYFTYERSRNMTSLYPWRHSILSPETGLQLPVKISILAEGIPNALLSKSCIISYDEEGNPVYKGGRIENTNWLTTETLNLGVFALEVDTLPPQIIPSNFRKGENLGNLSEIGFIIRDNLSNIASYNGFIDNQWVLFEYDPKNEFLFYSFEPTRLERSKNHKVELFVKDAVGNQSVFRADFYW